MRQDQVKLFLSALSANSVLNEMDMSCICTIAVTFPASPEKQRTLRRYRYLNCPYKLSLARLWGGVCHNASVDYVRRAR